ncbi:MAG: glycosyltransferase family 2 protein [Verrucomicrobiae bacterium]|nr:glycosyltransferase family 2 protein [Verrucomicrobiae bacterium]NNJ85823.1 glycosyltransferase family 2 protein [Akkermansiaceae bacterium]
MSGVPMKACIMIPSYNTGPLLRKTVKDALEKWSDVFVMIDGSTDGSDDDLESLASQPDARLRVHRIPHNKGKGAAFLTGIKLAMDEGFTHALAMDADGQHPASHIQQFMDAGADHPEALVLGDPVFDDSAPTIRIKGRKISNWWANFTTMWWGINDSLFGMRLYPLKPLRRVFSSTMGARRFDFDPECAVRLCWAGVPVINLPTPCRYLSEDEGGVSQFKYFRDNALLTWMYTRLFFGFLVRSPKLLVRKLCGGNPLKKKSS